VGLRRGAKIDYSSWMMTYVWGEIRSVKVRVLIRLGAALVEIARPEN
jgi:hypothetical protein